MLLDSFLSYLNSIAIFFSVVFGANYAIKNKGILCLKILSIQMFIVALFLLICIYIQPDKLIYHPYLFRMASPIIYTLAPIAFLFNYYFIRPEKRFNYWFLLLFVPLLFQIAENTKFYLEPLAIKIQEIENYLKFNNHLYHSSKYVWINPMVHAYIKIFEYLLFGVFMGRDIYLFTNGKLKLQPKNNVIVRNWLIGIFLFRLFSVFYLAYEYVFKFNPSSSTNGIEIILSLDIIFVIFYLLLNPSLLDVHYFQEYIFSHKPKLQKQPIRQDLSEEIFDNQKSELQIIAKKVDKFFVTQKDYLDCEFTVEKLSEKLEIPQRFISFAIKSEYEMSVKDYINKRRIEYLVELVQFDPEIKKYSFDYIGELIGFKSRQSLYSAIAKFYQCTPKELFDQLESL